MRYELWFSATQSCYSLFDERDAAARTLLEPDAKPVTVFEAENWAGAREQQYAFLGWTTDPKAAIQGISAMPAPLDDENPALAAALEHGKSLLPGRDCYDATLEFEFDGKKYRLVFERWGSECVGPLLDELPDGEEVAENWDSMMFRDRLAYYQQEWARRVPKLPWNPLLVEWESDDNFSDDPDCIQWVLLADHGPETRSTDTKP